VEKERTKYLKINDQIIRRGFITLLVISFAIRAVLAFWLEFGNDEVYYVLYARYPDWSHFDHPPMLGWLMQLTSLNLLLNYEGFLRFSSLIFMTINTLFVFRIGKLVKNEKTGFYAALLYSTSFYSAIITGIFILPDTPQNLCWIVSIWLILNLFLSEPESPKARKFMLLTGLTIGLGMISKYTSIYLWVGVLVYILFYDRRWLKQSSLYISLLISFICFLPVLLWNFSNDFVSFGFHANRIVWNSNPIRFDFLLTEFFGGIVYNNPANYLLIVISVIALFRHKIQLEKPVKRLLLLLSLPLIVTFLFFSLFRATLPHWTGPAYNTLLILAAVWLETGSTGESGKGRIPVLLKLSVAMVIIVITIGSLQVKFGIIPFKDTAPFHRIGKDDVTMDMYGWRDVKPAFEKTRNRLIAEGKMKPDCALIGENWFPLADFDYYVARPSGMKVFAMGSLDRIHKYYWVNKESGGFQLNSDYYYLTTSRDYKHPEQIFPQLFDQIIPSDTITIERNGKPAKRVFVYLLKGLKVLPNN
jgi:hypothetical protein